MLRIINAIKQNNYDYAVLPTVNNITTIRLIKIRKLINTIQCVLVFKWTQFIIYPIILMHFKIIYIAFSYCGIPIYETYLDM